MKTRSKTRITYGREWKKSYPGGRYTPTLDGGRIYLMTGFGRLVCVDAQAGAVAWSEDVAGKYGGIAPVHGFAEAPLVDGDKVICTPGGRDASLVGLDVETGKLLWSHPQDSDAQNPNHAITPAYCGGVRWSQQSGSNR